MADLSQPAALLPGHHQRDLLEGSGAGDSLAADGGALHPGDGDAVGGNQTVPQDGDVMHLHW